MATQKKPLAGPPAWQPRFGMRGIFLLMLVVSVMATAGYYLVQSLRGGRAFQLTFIIFTIAAPMIMVVVVSLVRRYFEGSDRRR